MKSEIASYIREHDGSPWLALRALVRSALASDFIRHVAETFTTKIVLIGLGLVTSVLVARILGPEGRGLYAVAATIAAIGTQFGNFGLHASNTYYVARDRKLLPTLIGNTLFISFTLGGCGAMAAWLFFSTWPNFAPLQGSILILALAWIPFGLAFMLIQNLFLGIQEIRTYNKIEVIMQLLGLILIAGIVIFKIVSAPALYSAALSAMILSFFWVLFRLKKHITSPINLSFTLFKKTIQYGGKAYLAALFAFLVLRADLLIIQYFLGPEKTGYYSIAASLADMVYMLPVVIATIFFPKLTSIQDKHAKLIFLRKVLLSAIPILVAIILFSVIFASFIITMLFGKDYSPAVPAFTWLLPGILFLSIQTIAVQFLNSEGFPKVIVAIWCAAFLFNIAATIYAVPRFGIIGASIASSFSYFFVFLTMSFAMKRALNG